MRFLMSICLFIPQKSVDLIKQCFEGQGPILEKV